MILQVMVVVQLYAQLMKYQYNEKGDKIIWHTIQVQQY